MIIVSLGWGVQSWGMVAMSALGALPKVDFALHADTGWERAETLAFAERWTPWLKRRGIPVVTVSHLVQSRKMLNDEPGASLLTQRIVEWVFGTLRGEHLFDAISGCFAAILPKTWRQNAASRAITPRNPRERVEFPAFTSWLDNSPSGMLRRQCTNRWKIQPMRRRLSAELKRQNLKKSPGIIEQWIGFTLDEAHRASPNDVQYITKRYPFLEMLERPWTRGMVIRWLEKHGLEVPVKSSCIVCPYHNWRQWREIQLADNGDWERAIEVDRAIRHRRPGYLCYLCDDRKPLEEHDFTRQLSYW